MLKPVMLSFWSYAAMLLDVLVQLFCTSCRPSPSNGLSVSVPLLFCVYVPCCQMSCTVAHCGLAAGGDGVSSAGQEQA